MGKLFIPVIALNGILWIVGLAVQVGGWVNQAIAIVLLVIALLWTIGLVWYWRKKGKDKLIKDGKN